MNQNVIVVPSPMPNRQQNRFGMKILLLGLQCALLMIGALIIWFMTYAREERNNDVANEIANNWGKAVCIEGPMAYTSADSSKYTSPKVFICKTDVATKTLHRNIYEAEVFNAHVNFTGTFDNESLTQDSVYLKLYINNVQQIYNLSPLKIGEKSIKWSIHENYLSATVNVFDMPSIINFLIEFDIRGSSGLYITQIGQKSKIAIRGEASNPSFTGTTLPDDRIVNDRTFSAEWTNIVPRSSTRDYYVGTNFLIGVDRYRKVSRSLKYAFIIILLTYVSVLFTEIVLKRDIPLMNYFLIGVALVLFYSLLLGFVEHISFGLSYLIASTMTVVLIGGYMWRMVGSRKTGITISAILTAQYLICYILLSLSTFALLFGSLLLFVALAAMMYGSLHSTMFKY